MSCAFRSDLKESFHDTVLAENVLCTHHITFDNSNLAYKIRELCTDGFQDVVRGSKSMSSKTLLTHTNKQSSNEIIWKIGQRWSTLRTKC